MYIENDGAFPSEYAQVEAHDDGKITVTVGTQDFGMGHQTMYAQIASDMLGIDFDKIDIFFGDTDRVRIGFGSAGSRSARLGGGAVVRGAQAFIERAKSLAAELFEAAVADIAYHAGELTVSGTDRKVNLTGLARYARQQDVALQAEAQFDSESDVHSNGCHICELDIDEQTGVIEIVRHILVADVGRAINPLIVAGQLHGGIAQGLGQAGFEQVVYDNTSGQTLTGSFMDYTIPRADDLPMFTTELNEVIEQDNPLGVKGAGEGPTTGSPAAMVNAVIDALSPLGVTQIDMPMTPFRVWSAMHAAESSRNRHIG
jgi:carbon-monoxide dehydrogenase large subunit